MDEHEEQLEMVEFTIEVIEMGLEQSPEAADAVKRAVTSASILSHIKANRIEYIGLVILCHLLGISDRLLAQISGVCF